MMYFILFLTSANLLARHFYNYYYFMIYDYSRLRKNGQRYLHKSINQVPTGKWINYLIIALEIEIRTDITCVHWKSASMYLKMIWWNFSLNLILLELLVTSFKLTCLLSLKCLTFLHNTKDSSYIPNADTKQNRIVVI